ncbi:MAG: hypothetical protein NTY74_05310 [Ignavibacteriae bacterium]|nr:hypothetical protein [Ignavibacteriota bacterium]
MKQIFFKALIGISILLFGGISYGQIDKRLDINLSPQEISSNSFNGQLSLTFKNISKDTIYITLDPFNIDVVNQKGFGNYVILKRTKYSPNRITFVKSDISISDLEGSSLISFLKFPRILILIPEEKYEFILNVDENTMLELRDSSWTVSKDIWCAVKSCVDNILKNKPLKIIEEFNEALVSKDKINIDLTSENQINPSVYFYNNIDSCNERDRCYTVYDSVILKCFKNYCY